ncbi:MAG: type II/IV secretion system ATPase subunit, partial [Candidatus Aenigmarchaeota archaeon]|nr:type II/IV secretion system ATPase subunit [Candidatus Aenigmarchaeota archaeon]
MSKTLNFVTNSGKRKFRVAPKPKEETCIRTGYFISNTNQIIPQLYPQIITSPAPNITVMPSTPNIKIVQGYGPEARETVIDEQMETKIKFRSGIAIPEMAEPVEKKDISMLLSEESPDLKIVDMKYPLIPQKPRKGEHVFAYAHIFYNKRSNELIYNVIEPEINEIEKKVLADIKEYIQEKLNINFAQIRKKEAFGYITNIFNRALEYFKVKFETSAEEKLKYYVFRDFVGLEMIEPFMKDKQIEDISCDGVNIPLYVYHRDPRFGSLKTNIIFKSADELDLFVNKLSEKCGKSISVARPLLDGTLPEGSRVQATLGSDIARHGSNFTIRMFTEEPLTPTDIIEFGTCDPRMMAYFWILVEHGLSFLVSGSTATGKTSFLNVLSLFIKPQMKIVSVEDTSELRLSHSHWIPEVARTPISETGKVDMFELLKSSLRQRPDYIIVGEVRGSEAYVLFQQMATGHPGLSTIHAENMSK